MKYKDLCSKRALSYKDKKRKETINSTKKPNPNNNRYFIIFFFCKRLYSFTEEDI